jgi:hypothetical protein
MNLLLKLAKSSTTPAINQANELHTLQITKEAGIMP